MKNYFVLQLKRVAKQFPSVFTITLLLFCGLAVILYGVLSMFYGGEGNKRFYVAVTGDMSDTYLQWGLSVVQSIDDSRFSIEFVEMEENAARKALENGDISAYVVFPEGFVENAMVGKVDPITYVTTAGMEGITSVFKKEITQLVTDIVIYSQKGVYGLADALRDNNAQAGMYDAMTELGLKYVELIFDRDGLYTVKELGISDGLSTPQYYICAISVMLLMLVGIPFAAIYIKKDYAFCRLLRSRGVSAGRQIACEYAVYLLSLLLLTGVMLLFTRLALLWLPGSAGEMPVDMAWKLIPVLIMVAAWNLLLFELSENMVSGLLMHFFAVISLCYVSGCIYPIYAFGKTIRQLAAWLPTGLARSHLATCFTYESAAGSAIGLFGYTVLFLGLTLWVRFRKTARIRG